MLIATRVVVFLVLVCCVFLKYSMSEKPPDCTKGKQYLSVDIVPSGTCAKCPPNWKTCDQQSKSDKESCLKSCRVIDTEKPKPYTNFTMVITWRPTPSKAPKITNKTNASLAVVYPPAKLPPGIKEAEDETPHVVGESLRKVVLVVVGCLCGLIFVIVVSIGAILLHRKIRKKPVQHQGEDGRLAEEGVPLRPASQPDPVADEEELRLAIPEEQQGPNVQSSIKQRPIVQASSGTNINETQNTHEVLNFSSNLNLDEEEN